MDIGGLSLGFRDVVLQTIGSALRACLNHSFIANSENLSKYLTSQTLSLFGLHNGDNNRT